MTGGGSGSVASQLLFPYIVGLHNEDYIGVEEPYKVWGLAPRENLSSIPVKLSPFSMIRVQPQGNKK